MVAASILPVALHKGKMYFLFGKENEMEDSAKGFSDFGGRVETGESIMGTAFREGSEELCGFLGDDVSIKYMLKRGGIYKISHNNYHIHIFLMEYDENLPRYFTNHHRFLWNRMDKDLLNDSKFFEKQEIRWFSVSELRTHKSEFRSFYQEIVDKLLGNMKKITSFVNKRRNATAKVGACLLSKTRKSQTRIEGVECNSLPQFSSNVPPKGEEMNEFDRLLSASKMRKGVKKGG